MMRFSPALLVLIWTFTLGTLASLGTPHRSHAQASDAVVWVQIEAQPSLAAATDRARAYATLLQDVNGFALGGGWYGIAVGPYRRADAELVLRSYRRDGLVPNDSFIQFSGAFRQQFWPVGANILNRGVIDPPASLDLGTGTPAPSEEAPAATISPQDDSDLADDPAAQTAAQPDVIPVAPADETPAEARRSEQELDRDARMELQVALQWAGFYTSTIDGAFGRGTRRSMGAWQAANGYAETGILTSLQRRELLRQYNAVLADLDLQPVRDERAGIEILMPRAEVEFVEYEPPFAHYNAVGDRGARVLLISQEGDQDSLRGLYDIMQTLAIVPEEGPRELSGNSFELIGEDGHIVSQTQVSLRDGKIKGFTLIWPVGDEDRRRRLVAEMAKSLTRLPGVLDPARADLEAQSIDLVAGLQIRRPKIARSGFFINSGGVVATTSQAVQSCRRLTLDGDTEAHVVLDDTASGVALLQPSKPIAPLAVARFSPEVPRLQSEISVAGYSYEGVLSAATLTFGTLADLRGLQGEEHLSRLALKSLPGDVGGPVFDASGNVLGMLLPRPGGAQQLPEEVSFALDRERIAKLAKDAGVTLETADDAGSPAPRDLAREAQNMTVLVSCWE